MRILVDWLSFTLPVIGSDGDLEGFASNVVDTIYSHLGEEIFENVFNKQWIERSGGRAPYSYSHDVGTTGVVVFTNPKRRELLVEIGGQGCEYIRSQLLLHETIGAIQATVTRLDMAVDIETETLPNQFVPEANYPATFSYSKLSSQSGETVYLGSQHSEKFIRIYRYKAPHPRHKLLRVEFVFRRKVARAVCGEMLIQGEKAVAAWAGEKAKLLHPAWNLEDDHEKFFVYDRPEREAGKTTYWLIQSVAPAFKRLVREGIITDPLEFLQTYFMPEEV